MMLGGEAGRHVRIDIELPQDTRASPDQDDQLRASLQVAREVVPHRGDVGHVLVLAGRDRGAADAAPDGDVGVLRFAPREGLEHELVALQHVGVDRGERRAEASDALAREPEQVLA